MNRIKCIYAILDSNQKSDLKLKWPDGSFIHTSPYKDISAAVGDIDKADLEVNKECVLAYERIMESLMARYTLLPMRFGTLVKTDKEVSGLLEKCYDRFVINLRQVKGKLEYGLKALWDIEETNLEIRTLSETEDPKGIDRLKGSSPHKRYLLEKLKEHRFEKALMTKAEKIIEDIHNPLKELSSLSECKKMVTEKIILDAAYLVEEQKKGAFIQRFGELREKRRDLKFLLTGPWPPYNFVKSFNFKKEVEINE